ncbi:MAG: hypothetical protein V1720_00585 [bacterium]
MKTIIKSFAVFVILISVISQITCKREGEDASYYSKTIHGDLEKFQELLDKHNAIPLPSSVENYSSSFQEYILKNNIVIDTVISDVKNENGKYFLTASVRSIAAPSVFTKLRCGKEEYELIKNLQSKTAYVAAKIKRIDKTYNFEEAFTINDELICFNNGDRILLTGELTDIVEYN